eukprot:TRINITY_DN6779_c0_g3_i1.p1 TRINITY_DN6779_c0_g3~~TRINITY_DN6779_c0_g3_i1.p1  ORF type:complete len:221 (+),score=39.45 TRINITY_DN6779_c0_g3_i1:59-664(+)
MDEMMESVQAKIDEILNEVVSTHDAAMSELGEAWENSTFGDLDFSLEGMHGAVVRAKDQAYDEAMAFYSAVDWNEWWIRCMGGVHAVLWGVWLCTVIFGSSSNFKIGFFGIVVLLTLSASYLNDYGSDHWKEFSTQNYFDANGTFLAVTWCFPMLLLLFFLLIQILLDVGRLLVKVKAEQFKRERARKHGKKEPAESKKTK